MEIKFVEARNTHGLDRIYIAAAQLANFRGKPHLETQLFRSGADEAELVSLRGMGLVGAPDPEMPPEVLTGATEDAALHCVLEAFTLVEARQLADYLGNRYADQMERLVICPMDLPIPLGVGSLAAIPETATSGFINFDLARDYPLPFKFKGYYDLAQ